MEWSLVDRASEAKLAEVQVDPCTYELEDKLMVTGKRMDSNSAIHFQQYLPKSQENMSAAAIQPTRNLAKKSKNYKNVQFF